MGSQVFLDSGVVARITALHAPHMCDAISDSQPLQRQLLAMGLEFAGLQGAECAVMPLTALVMSSTAESGELPTWPAARRQQYQAGRLAAAEALKRSGFSGAVGRSDDGCPVWPAGVIGSIAHTDLRAVAVVAPSALLLALGIDTEPDLPLPDEALTQVLTVEDQSAIRELALRVAHPAERLARWVFSAKECVHKALNPLNGAWLELDAVWIDWLDPASLKHGRWRPCARQAEACVALQGLAAEGYWWLDDSGITTLLLLKAPHAASLTNP